MIDWHTWRRRFDSGYLVILALSLLAVWPFISRASLPEATDAELHIYRLAELSYLVRAGEFYPRWAPNFYYGYGYPIFNYYAPLVYYLGLGVELLPRLDAVAGVKAVFILGLLLAAVGMYGFVRDNWGQGAGFVAAAVYLYAPYIQYVDPHARGDLAEAFAFALLPLALWSLDRLRRQPKPGRWLTAVLLVTAVILSHNLMAMVFFAILLAWTGWRLLIDREDGRYFNGRFQWLLPTALLLGVGLAAFFWLPVALEQKAVNLDTLVGDGDHFDFRNHFLSWRTLLAASPLLDWGASEADFVLNLGLAQWLLGGMGLIAWLCGRAAHGRHLAFFVVVLAGLLFLMFPASTFLWETIPLLPFLQFPWRLLGAAVAMLAVLAGAGTAALAALLPARLRAADLVPALLVAFVLLFALPLAHVLPWPADFGPVTPWRTIQVELAGRWLGTTSTADFVPATVDVLPRPEGTVLDDLFNGRPPDRVNRATLPEGTDVVTEIVTPLRMRYHVTGAHDFPLRLFLFDFPGWTARIDGQPVATELAQPEGFLLVPVPAGSHVVEVYFGSTPARRWAAAVTTLSLLLTLLIAWRLSRRAPLSTALPPANDFDPRPWRLTPLLGTILAILALYIFLVEPLGWLRYESTGFVAEPAQNQTFADFDSQIALIGYDLPDGRLAPGSNLHLNLYWKAQQPLAINYQVFVHLLDADGAVVAQSDKLNPGEFPTRRWSVDKYVRDAHHLRLPPELPAGSYRLTTGLYVLSEGWRLPRHELVGQPVADHFLLRTFQVGGQ
jgi:hypothetical protein